jgi:type I restriction enzyme S subunit
MLEDQVKAHGSTNYSAIRPGHVLKYEIPLPPLAEQRRIVSRIEALAGRLAAAQTLRREAIEETRVICASARNRIFGHLQKTIKPVRLDEIAEMRLGKMLSMASKVGASPLPYLRNANIQWDRLDLSSINLMDFDESEKTIFRLKAGDILVCEGGDIGKSAIWNDELPECYFQKALHRIRVNTELTFPRYILNNIFWGAEQKHFFDLKTQTTIPHLTGVKLKAYKVFLPPLEEQRRLVAYLDGLQAQISQLRLRQEETQKELDALMPSILDKAFKGEL